MSFTPWTDISAGEGLHERKYPGQQFEDIQSIAVGNGSKVMRVDERGLWLGAKEPGNAPFAVDMDGNISGSSLTLANFSGDLDDIDDGTTHKRAVQSQLTGGDRAFNGLNSASQIIKGYLANNLSSVSLPNTGVRIDANGIYGRKSGSTTFFIDTNGDATFSGDVISASITSSTITGGTIKTDTTGRRVEIATQETSQVTFYDADGTLAGALDAENLSGSPVLTLFNGTDFFQIGTFTGEASDVRMMSGGNSGTGVKVYSGTGTVKIYGDLEPESSGSNHLGSSSVPWNNVYCEDIYSPSERVLDVNQSPAPQWTVPMGFHIRSGTPGSASSYQGYMYYDTDKSNLVFSDGNGWFELQASAY